MGLSAMAPKRPIFKNSSILLIRPLLGVEKSQIIAYLKMRNIPWWDDPSNTYDMTRNRLRHQVIPFLQEKGYKDATSALCRTAKRCQEISAYLQTQADFFLAHSCQNFCPKKTELEAFLALVQGKNNLVSIPKEKWDSLSLALLPFVLQRIYEGFGQECLLRERHYEIFQKWKKQNQTTWQLPGDVLATRQFYSVCFYWQDPKIVWKIPQSFSVPAYVDLSNFSKLEASFGNWQAWKQSHPTNTLLEVCVNKENTELPLHLEFCKNEDKIHPFGFPSQRKIFHILSDAKIPPPIRKKILTVRDNRGKILWVPGIAVSEQNLATSDNTEVIILKITAH
jgi:tRNA(Ile)-lysidine synthase